MEKNKTLVLLGVLIICLLSVGVAFLRLSERQSSSVSGKSASVNLDRKNFKHASAELVREQQRQALKNQEILGMEPPVTLQTSANGPTSSLEEPISFGVKVPTANRAFERENTKGQAAGNVSNYSADSAYQAADHSFHTPSSQTGTERNHTLSGSNTAIQASSGGLSAQSSSLSPQGAITRTMAPFLRGLTKEQADALNRSLDGLSTRVERAILQATLPKSKKDANIEKYLQRNRADNSQGGVAAGPFANVLQQVSSQKETIVKSMGNAYGSAAAKEAGKIMSSYQNELSSVLENGAGKIPEELAKQARALSNKYMDKLDKASEKYGLEKFKQENMAKDQAYLAQVERTYGAEMSAQMGKMRNEALEQKMQLAQEKELTTEEAYEKHLEIERNLWQKEQDLLISQGYSPTQLYKIKKEQREKEQEQNEQDEQDGKKLAKVYRMSEKQQSSYLTAVQKQNQQMQQNDAAAYGSRGADVLQSVYDRYTNEVQQIIADQETSQDEKDKALQQASQRANAELARLKKTPEMRQMRVDTTLGQIMQDPALQKASPEQREAFKEHARPVLEEMFEKATQIEESNLSEPEKRRQLQALQDEAHRRLSGQ